MSKKRSTEEWCQIVDDWRASGLAQGEYALQNALNVRSLRWWAWNLSGAPSAGGATRSKPLARSATNTVDFLPMRIEERTPAGKLRIRVDGLPLTIELEEGFSRSLLLEVLDSLC